jgi:hypothetical protein
MGRVHLKTGLGCQLSANGGDWKKWNSKGTAALNSHKRKKRPGLSGPLFMSPHFPNMLEKR